MIDQLFGSKTRVKLLSLFFNNPNRQFYVREITRKIDEQINSVRRELSNLLTIGIISSQNQNNKLYYEVNQTYQYYKPFKQIFSSAQIAAKADVDNDVTGFSPEFRQLGSVKVAYLLGKFLKKDAPVDIFIVGDVNKTKLQKLVADLEASEGQELNYAVMDEKEYDYRLEINDRFLSDIVESTKTVVIDDKNSNEEKE